RAADLLGRLPERIARALEHVFPGVLDVGGRHRDAVLLHAVAARAVDESAEDARLAREHVDVAGQLVAVRDEATIAELALVVELGRNPDHSSTSTRNASRARSSTWS